MTDQGYVHLCPRGQGLNTWGEEGRVQPEPCSDQLVTFCSVLHCVVLELYSTYFTYAHDEGFVLVGMLLRPNLYTDQHNCHMTMTLQGKFTFWFLVLAKIPFGLLKIVYLYITVSENVDMCAWVEMRHTNMVSTKVSNNDYFDY